MQHNDLEETCPMMPYGAVDKICEEKRKQCTQVIQVQHH